MHARYLTRTSLVLLLSLLVGPLAWISSALAQQPGGPLRFNGPATAPATRPTTRPVDRDELDRRRLANLSRRAIEQIRTQRYAEAEKTLGEAILMAPTHSVNLYNMACVKALRGQQQGALDYLERAALAGFTDFVHMDRDPDLVNVRELPRYKGLLARKDELQRRAADRVVEWLKGELGEGYLFEIDAANKLIFATNTDATTLESLRNWLVKQARSQWQMLFEHKPDHYVSVVVPSAADYRKIVSQPGVGGFYNHDNRILIARQLGQVMTHEFTHALHNADTDSLGQEHAIWLAEGLGAMFEAASFNDQDVLVPADNFRLATLQDAARRGRLVPLEKLLAMEQKDFVANAQVTLTYGQAGSVCLYLHEQGLLRKFYETYKASYDQDKTGKLALATATGKDLPAFEADWKAWMVARPPVRMNTGPQGAYLGVRFENANDGLKIGFVLPNGAAFNGGVRAGDVVVGVNGADVRDQYSLMPLLSSQKPGDQIRLKVRRGTEYLELPVTLGTRDTPLRRRVRPQGGPPAVDTRPNGVK